MEQLHNTYDAAKRWEKPHKSTQTALQEKISRFTSSRLVCVSTIYPDPNNESKK